MRSWIVSRTARAVATHQSRGVAEPAWRASVETRWRWISERSTSTGVSLVDCGWWITISDGADSKGTVLPSLEAGPPLGGAGGVVRAARLDGRWAAAVAFFLEEEDFD